MVGWGLSLVPFGLGAPTALTVACFMLGGVIYGPFVALSVTLMRSKSPPQHLAAMLAARSAALLTASPLGTGATQRVIVERHRRMCIPRGGHGER